MRLALGLAVALASGAGCGRPPADAPSRVVAGTPPMRLLGVAFEGWSGDVRELALEARQATVDLETRVALLEDVRIGLAGDAEHGPLDVRAPTGEFDLARDALWLRGGVEGRTGPGERFTTDELRLDQSRGTLVSSSPVHLERADLELDADSMELDMRQRRLRLEGSVAATLEQRP